MNLEYRLASKVTSGPMGIHCPCCNGYHKGRSMKATKTRINRINRRAAKQNLHNTEIDS